MNDTTVAPTPPRSGDRWRPGLHCNHGHAVLSAKTHATTHAGAQHAWLKPATAA